MGRHDPRIETTHISHPDPSPPCIRVTAGNKTRNLMRTFPKLIPYRATPILLYHQIAETVPGDRILLSIPPERFRSQMKYLRDRGYTAVTLDELAQIENGGRADSRKVVAISFD